MSTKHLEKKVLRDFGILLGIFFPLIFGLLLPFIFAHSISVWSFWLGGGFLGIGILKPTLLSLPYKYWMLLGNILGWINSRIILSLVFILVLCPIAFFMKFFKYDPLNLQKMKTRSYKILRKDKDFNFKKIF